MKASQCRTIYCHCLTSGDGKTTGGKILMTRALIDDLIYTDQNKFCNTNLSRYISIAETCALWCMQIRETRESLGELEIAFKHSPYALVLQFLRFPKLILVFL